MTDINISSLPAITVASDDDMLVINDANSITSIISWKDISASITELSGQISFEAGTEALPSIVFDGDPNTGIYQPGDTSLLSLLVVIPVCLLTQTVLLVLVTKTLLVQLVAQTTWLSVARPSKTPV